jgi:sec-independent protein translocase protein TatB
VFDIGIGELIALAVIGLMIFGPEKLPKAAADAAKWIKQIRAMAVDARKDLAESSGIDLNETLNTVKGLGDYHPKKLASSLFTDEDDDVPSDRKPGDGKAAQPPAFDPDTT